MIFLACSFVFTKGNSVRIGARKEVDMETILPILGACAVVFVIWMLWG